MILGYCVVFFTKKEHFSHRFHSKHGIGSKTSKMLIFNALCPLLFLKYSNQTGDIWTFKNGLRLMIQADQMFGQNHVQKYAQKMAKNLIRRFDKRQCQLQICKHTLINRLLQ